MFSTILPTAAPSETRLPGRCAPSAGVALLLGVGCCTTSEPRRNPRHRSIAIDALRVRSAATSSMSVMQSPSVFKLGSGVSRPRTRPRAMPSAPTAANICPIFMLPPRHAQVKTHATQTCLQLTLISLIKERLRSKITASHPTCRRRQARRA